MFVYIVVDVPMCLFATFKEFVCSLLKTFRIIIYCQPHSVFSFGWDMTRKFHDRLQVSRWDL